MQKTLCNNYSGAFVNFDVPDYSVVIGNPGIIHKKHINDIMEI